MKLCDHFKNDLKLLDTISFFHFQLVRVLVATVAVFMLYRLDLSDVTYLTNFQETKILGRYKLLLNSEFLIMKNKI